MMTVTSACVSRCNVTGILFTCNVTVGFDDFGYSVQVDLFGCLHFPPSFGIVSHPRRQFSTSTCQQPGVHVRHAFNNLSNRALHCPRVPSVFN